MVFGRNEGSIASSLQSKGHGGSVRKAVSTPSAFLYLGDISYMTVEHEAHSILFILQAHLDHQETPHRTLLMNSFINQTCLDICYSARHWTPVVNKKTTTKKNVIAPKELTTCIWPTRPSVLVCDAATSVFVFGSFLHSKRPWSWGGGVVWESDCTRQVNWPWYKRNATGDRNSPFPTGAQRQYFWDGRVCWLLVNVVN